MTDAKLDGELEELLRLVALAAFDEGAYGEKEFDDWWLAYKSEAALVVEAFRKLVPPAKVEARQESSSKGLQEEIEALRRIIFRAIEKRCEIPEPLVAAAV